MNIKDIITVTKQGFLRGGKKFIATLDGTNEYPQGMGNTSAEAIQELSRILTEHCKHANDREYLFSPSGKTMLVLYHSPGGWGYDIVTAGDGGSRGSTGMGEIPKSLAVERARAHALSYTEEQEAGIEAERNRRENK